MPIVDPRSPRVLVIVPAFNEARTVGIVTEEIKMSNPSMDVLVVDDGSTDHTAALARAAGAIVCRLPFNLGVGGAMRAGFRYALDAGYDVAVQVDADGQHDPTYISKLVVGLDDADVVIGARFAGVGSYRVRGPRRWAMSLLAPILSWLAGTRLTDVTSGYRAANRRALAVFAAHYPTEYLGDTMESLVIALRTGCTIRQIPVEMRPRTEGVSTQSPLRASVYLVRAVTALMLALVRQWPMPVSAGESDMTPEIILGLLGGSVTLGVLFEMLRRRRLREKYALFWVAVALLTMLVAARPALLTWAANVVGVQVPTNLLFFVASMVLMVVSIQHSHELGRMEERTRTLAEEVALLRIHVEMNTSSEVHPCDTRPEQGPVSTRAVSAR